MNRCFFAICFVLAASATAFAQEKVHTVQKGETVYSIARSLGVRSEELMKYNGISDPTKLWAGQRLRIPGAGAAHEEKAPGAPAYHKAARGETLYGIALRYGLSLDALLMANNLPAHYVLKEGDTLAVSGNAPAKKTPAPAEKADSPAAPEQGAKPAAAAAKQGDPRQTAAQKVDGSVLWPVEAKELSYLTGKLSGVAITGEKAEEVRSLTEGTVVSAGVYRGFGKVAIVQAKGGYLYVYGGCDNLVVREGDKVGAGAGLGTLGVDAVSGKAQLFFMVYQGSAPVDPAKAPRA
ncbi:MAG: LysM domain/M23/M37 peptidase domain protein [Treponematales bacterium]